MTTTKGPRRILSGVQPSGKLHLGNYFGAIKQHIALQHEAETFYFIADYHALTTVHDKETLRQNVLDVALDYLALGLDPAKAVFFRQSDVPEVTELAWIFSTVTNMGLLERAVSYKEKVEKGIEASVGLFTYPVLMASDILIYRSHLVPVGKRPGAAPRDDRRHRRPIQPGLCRGLPHSDGPTRQGFQGAGHRRPEDEQILRQHHRDFRRGQGAAEDRDEHRDRQQDRRRSEGSRHLQRLRAVQPVRQRRGKSGTGGAAIGLAAWATATPRSSFSPRWTPISPQPERNERTYSRTWIMSKKCCRPAPNAPGPKPRRQWRWFVKRLV